MDSLKTPTVEVIRPKQAGERKTAFKNRMTIDRHSRSGQSQHLFHFLSPPLSAVVNSPPEDPRVAELNSDIDKINKALGRNEKEILNRLRTPLDTGAPMQDLEKRQQENEVRICCNVGLWKKLFSP